jgi:hypothetical protein
MRRNQIRIGVFAIFLVMAAAIAPAIGARAADPPFPLRPRYQVGDRYALALSTQTKTRVEARGGARNAFHEDVELRYSAQVEVLATDPVGAPVRERHENVDLRYERPDGKSALFKKGVTLELTRRADGSVEIVFEGERVAPKIEQIVGDLLAHQTEYGVIGLLDPGRPVAPGDRWELEPAAVKSFLRARGMRDVELDGSATAKLVGGDGKDLAVRYRIPIRAFSLRELPEGATRSGSEASLDGEVQLDPHGFHRARTHTSELALHIQGALSAASGAPAARWSLHRSESVDQHTETLKDQLASSE